MSWRTFLVVLSLSCLLPRVSSSALATAIVNGGFESPSLSLGSDITFGPGGEPAGFGWTVASGTVDLIHLPVSPWVMYVAYEGGQALDLNGLENGAIDQQFATASGQPYSLTFAFADNPTEDGPGNDNSTALVEVVDVASSTLLLSATISHNSSTNQPSPNADWSVFSGSFTAIGSLARLSFTSTATPADGNSAGIVLDDVSVVAVPEPSSFLLVSTGLAGLICALWMSGSQRRR